MLMDMKIEIIIGNVDMFLTPHSYTGELFLDDKLKVCFVKSKIYLGCNGQTASH